MPDYPWSHDFFGASSQGAPKNPFGGVTLLGYDSTTFEIPTNVPIKDAMAHLLQDGDESYDVYQRLGHPYSRWLEGLFKASASTRAKHALVWTSGMGSIDVAILELMVAHFIPKGLNHIVASDDLYGGVYDLLMKFYPVLGIRTTFVDVTNPLNIAKAIQPNTALFYSESLSNPQQKILPYDELMEIKQWTRRKYNPDFAVVVDTTLTPMSAGFALRKGIDVAVIATTKYESGHSDTLGGLLLTNDTRLYNILFGGRRRHAAMTPQQCKDTARGLETITLRVSEQEKNALRVAEYLERHPAIEKVIYAGLPSHPQKDLVSRQFAHVGSVVSFVLKGDYECLERFRHSLQNKSSGSPWTFGVSLGGTHSLFEFPHYMTHGAMGSETKINLGIVPNFVRLAIGIDSERTLLESLAQALDASKKT